MRQRLPRIRIQKILDSANGEDCTLQIAGVCNFNPKTTVAAHSNMHEDGKGAGTKAHDIFTCYACSACHEWLDGGYVRDGYTSDFVAQEFHKALKRTWLRLIQKGVLK